MTCTEELTALRTKYGYSQFDHAVKSLMRQRLDAPGRPKRIHVSLNARWKMYRRQKGICYLCNKEMLPDEKLWDVDHIVSDAEDFNGKSNLGLSHLSCNRAKGAKSLVDLAKETGTTVEEYLHRTGDLNEAPEM